MTIEKKLLGTSPILDSGAEAVSFDGSSDSLSRSSDLTGNADGKTFTFSGWVYQTGGNKHIRMINLLDSGTSNFEVYANDGYLYITGWDTAHSTQVIEASLALRVPIKTWSHVLISADMTSTLNRYVYVDDIDYSSTISWYSYSNADINFTNNNPVIGSTYASADYSKGRLAHLFLDHTYRDLSITANRRLFIDADGKPASGQADLSPVLYLPLKDADTAGSNSGTGGDFTVNGVLATAERGPNQDNCSASYFNGSADYLSRSSITGIADGKQFTLSCSIIAPSTNEKFILGFGADTTDRFYMYTQNAGGGKVSVKVEGENAAGTIILSARIGDITLNSHISIALSVDLTDTSKRYCTVDGVSVDPWDTYTNDIIDFYPVSTKHYNVGSNVPQNKKYEGDIGELYFDTTYMDLSTDNPFWDSDANRPNSVRKVIADTGVTPLIALPMIGSDAGNNLGSGGDFTVNSGPFTGARGGSEYWARSAGASGSGYLRNASLSASNGKNVTFVFAYTVPASAGVIQFENGSGSQRMKMFLDTTGGFDFEMMNSSGGNVLRAIASSVGASLGAWCVALVSVDLTNSSNRSLYINGSIPTTNWSTYSNTDIAFSEMTRNDIFQGNGGFFPFDLGAMYFNNSYTDFSQEANRNKFVDQLGYPIDLTQQIEDGDIPDPLIYMKFDDTAALGTNSGTGGNFTVNGTVTAGADVNPT